jgi:TonB-dependent starch-binding outer membrane protein SusC
MKILSICLLMVCFACPLIAQIKSISGIVTSTRDSSGLPGINVILKGTTNGTITDKEGKFNIIVSDSDKTLIFRGISYHTREVDISTQTFLKVVLTEYVQEISEVVVTGYGTQNRKTLISSISTVASKEIQNLSLISFDQAIQGRASGVQVASTSGEPGTGLLVRIRGATSISASSDPLYIIDGIPIVSGDLSKIIAGSGTNALSDINSNDIQSIEILKDASASAIYGARAANGVVLITTKRGLSSSTPSITIDMAYGMAEAAKDPNRLRVDGPTFELLQNESSRNNWIDKYGSLDGLDANGNIYKPIYENPETTMDTNWLKEIFRRASIRNLNVGIRGGNEKIKYFLSANDTRQEGIVKPTEFHRRGGRLNFDLDVSKRMKLGANASYSNTTRNRASNGNDVSGALTTAFFYPSNIPIYKSDGSYNKPIWENPVAAVNETDYLMKTERLTGNVFSEYKIAKSLVFKTSVGIDNSLIDEYRYFNTKLNAGAAVNGLASSFITSDKTWINENTFFYSANLNKHSADVLVGNSIQDSEQSVNYSQGQQFPSDAFRQMSAAAVITSAGTSSTKYGLISFFSRINYSFKEKYLLTFNVRSDASSKFGVRNRWAAFPSLAIGWLVTEENFIDEFLPVNFLKLRGSIGTTGNQSGINNFQSLGLWGGQPGGLRAGGGTAPINNVGTPAAYANAPGFVPNQLANPDLKWETTTQLDLGVDLGLFNNRISATFDYYNKQTTDLLLAVPIPKSLGYNQLVQNYGKMENKGWEIGINTSVVSRPGFNWNISLNLSHNKNKVKKLLSPFTAFSRDFIRVEEGYPLFSFWVHEQNSVDKQTGNIIWNTGSDDKFDPNVDRFIVGNAQPDLFGGINNSITYKNFDLTCFFQFSYGNEVLNYNRYFYEHGGERTTGYTSTQLKRWQKPGDVTDVPRMAKINYSTDLRPSRFVEDGSYLRIKTLTIGYNVPEVLISKVSMKKLRLFIASQNLITFTRYSGLDPEVSVDASELIRGIDFATIPQPRTILGGVTLGF